MGLLNFLFAAQRGGAFVLRIEDTDRARFVATSEQMIFDALRWTGLSWDEGPDVGGPYGPYRQSERTEIYREHADLLLANGTAYRCFCTADDLEAARRASRNSDFSTEGFKRLLHEVDHCAYPAGDVDLLIRTGSEQRLSDFLLWECAYAELYFADCLWPDFDERRFRQALEAFAGRQRRFGALGGDKR